MLESVSVLEQKQSSYKNQLLKHLIKYDHETTIYNATRILNISIPTATNLIESLCEEKWLIKGGKTESAVGRKAVNYFLNKEAVHFVGVEIQQNRILIGAVNLQKQWIGEILKFEYSLQNTIEALDQVVAIIKDFIKLPAFQGIQIAGVCIILPGRVNTNKGENINYFNFLPSSFAVHMSTVLGIMTTIDNDTRAIALGEYYTQKRYHNKSIIYIHVDYGLGMNLIINDEVFYGKNGYSGELGHTFFEDNNILCHCGKSGCLETVASGKALLRLVKEALATGKTSQVENIHPLHVEDIIKALFNNDSVIINIVETMGNKLGMSIANLINMLNPDMIILGGVLAQTKNYILWPIKNAINKYCLNVVADETEIMITNTYEHSGIYGACIVALEKHFI